MDKRILMNSVYGKNISINEFQLNCELEDLSNKLYIANIIFLNELECEFSKLDKPKYEEYTCSHCVNSRSCDYSFHLYNTDGDCLASK